MCGSYNIVCGVFGLLREPKCRYFGVRHAAYEVDEGGGSVIRALEAVRGMTGRHG